MQKLLETMTLEEKVGQLFTFYYHETSFGAEAELYIEGFKAGGIFLDMGCLDSPEQVHELTGRMQRSALDNGSGQPLFIAADFVAGAGCKLPRGGAVYFPKNMAIGAAADEELAYETGRVTAEESLAMGVNFNYSPVVDINNNPNNPVIGTHSFGDTRELVTRMGACVIRGYQEHGMIATAKHFPGHGDTNVDSHLDLPVLNFDRERLETFELAPFRAAITAGVEAVMIGHIAVPAIDPSCLPASLSYSVITELLRKEMGFEGLIVTDGMSMKGVTSAYTQSKACVMALKAGADIVLVCPANREEAQEMVGAVLEAVRSGELSIERIDESAARIIRSKRKYGLTSERFEQLPFDPSRFDTASSRAISMEVARKAIQIHGDQSIWSSIQSLAHSGPMRIRLICEQSLPIFADRVVGDGAAAELKRIDAYDQLPDTLEQWGEDGPVIAAITCNKRMRRDVLERINRVAVRCRNPLLLVHFGSPYDAEFYTDIPVLLMHDRAPSLQEAAAEYIKGLLGNEGRERQDAE
ncbi:hypothetical protein D3P07_24520 [Paenibacillus sp. 1011MAR3C5]|uniref:glycoside hydrolase family 3 protein n=1 Tax=Paenibacillus sp. 1011MAR3C5 TaxID=1675787 RepID=UPI000E6CEDD2|nr:glycoside hydrolase family 3 N-terminal domain-containing protein [Paenibacillus sp. 1011MAR3C5]RJE83971.1 hypothetical protein D3P07_24520 [Paenibacillus sp. 1011MAR3C5]